MTAPWRRNEHGALAGVKSTSYAENVRALAYATERAATEAIFVNTVGNVCEGTGSNIFFVFGEPGGHAAAGRRAAGRHHPRGAAGVVRRSSKRT